MVSNRGYSAEAPVLIPRYEALKFDDVHAGLLDLYPPPPSRVLDVGAGTGRDASALACRGHEVWAVEPTLELREAGRTIHSAVPIRWLEDALPDLSVVRAERVLFDLILLVGVWMHLDEVERTQGIATLRHLISPGGRIVFMLRHGPVPAGRRMFDVTEVEMVALAQAQGFVLVRSFKRAAITSSHDVTWSCLVFEVPMML